MDYFKILTLILLIILCYKVFFVDCKTTEGFESVNSNLDDGVAINALAQLARSLMSTGSTTIPGTLIVPGGLNLTAPLNAGQINAGQINANTSYFGTGTSKVQIGQGFREGGACVYANGNTLELGSSNNNVLVHENLFVDKNLTAGNSTSNNHTLNGHLNVTYGGHVTGNFNVVNGDFCIGNTCINENHLQILKGTKPIALTSVRDGQIMMNWPGDHFVSNQMWNGGRDVADGRHAWRITF